MSRPTQASLHPVNPVLQNVLIGLANDPASFIADDLVPATPVMDRSGTLLKVTDDSMFGVFQDSLQRAPGADSNLFPGIGLSNTTFSSYEYDQYVPVDNQQAKESPIDLPAAQMAGLLNNMKIDKELRYSRLLFSTTYVTGYTTLTGGDQWTVAGSDPVSQIESEIATIEAAGGVVDTILFGRVPWRNFLKNASVLSFAATNTNRQILSSNEGKALLAEKFDIPRVFVGKARYNTVGMPLSTNADIWGDAVLIGCFAKPPRTARTGPGELAITPTGLFRPQISDWKFDQFDIPLKKSTGYRASYDEGLKIVNLSYLRLLNDTTP